MSSERLCAISLRLCVLTFVISTSLAPAADALSGSACEPLAHDVLRYFAQVEEIRRMSWDQLAGGHVCRIGTHADVDLQAEFLHDVKQAGSAPLVNTKFGIGLDPGDWRIHGAGCDNYIDRVAIDCVKRVTPKRSQKLAAFERLYVEPMFFDGTEPAHRLMPQSHSIHPFREFP